MKQAHVTDRLAAYVLGDLPPGERAAVEQHLGDCEGCRASLREAELTLDLLRDALAAPSAAPARLSVAHRARILRQRDAPRRSAFAWFAAPHRMLAAAAAAVALAGCFAVLLRGMQPRPESSAVSAMKLTLHDADMSTLADAPAPPQPFAEKPADRAPRGGRSPAAGDSGRFRDVRGQAQPARDWAVGDADLSVAGAKLEKGLSSAASPKTPAAPKPAPVIAMDDGTTGAAGRRADRGESLSAKLKDAREVKAAEEGREADGSRREEAYRAGAVRMLAPEGGTVSASAPARTSPPGDPTGSADLKGGGEPAAGVANGSRGRAPAPAASSVPAPARPASAAGAELSRVKEAADITPGVDKERGAADITPGAVEGKKAGLVKDSSHRDVSRSAGDLESHPARKAHAASALPAVESPPASEIADHDRQRPAERADADSQGGTRPGLREWRKEAPVAGGAPGEVAPEGSGAAPEPVVGRSLEQVQRSTADKSGWFATATDGDAVGQKHPEGSAPAIFDRRAREVSNVAVVKSDSESVAAPKKGEDPRAYRLAAAGPGPGVGAVAGVSREADGRNLTPSAEPAGPANGLAFGEAGGKMRRLAAPDGRLRVPADAWDYGYAVPADGDLAVHAVCGPAWTARGWPALQIGARVRDASPRDGGAASDIVQSLELRIELDPRIVRAHHLAGRDAAWRTGPVVFAVGSLPAGRSVTLVLDLDMAAGAVPSAATDLGVVRWRYRRAATGDEVSGERRLAGPASGRFDQMPVAFRIAVYAAVFDGIVGGCAQPEGVTLARIEQEVAALAKETRNPQATELLRRIRAAVAAGTPAPRSP